MDIIIELFDNYDNDHSNNKPAYRYMIKNGRGMYMRYIPEADRHAYGLGRNDIDRNDHYFVAEEKYGELYFFKLSTLVYFDKTLYDNDKPVYTVGFLTEGANEHFMIYRAEKV